MSIITRILGEKKVDNTISTKPFIYVSPELKVAVEQFKSVPMDEKTTKLISNELGEPHPFDYNTCEGLYKQYGLVTGIIDKIIDFTIGPGIYIDCKDEKGQKILQEWVDDNNLEIQLKPFLREALTKGSGYLEVAIDKNKNVVIKPINSSSMYVKRNNKGEKIGRAHV